MLENPSQSEIKSAKNSLTLGFVDSLSCSVIMNAATNTTFIDMLSGPDLKALLRSINFWSCIPIDVIRTIMNNNKIGNKISLNDIVVAAPLLARTKKIDEDVIVSLFQYDVDLLPTFSSVFKRIFFFAC